MLLHWVIPTFIGEIIMCKLQSVKVGHVRVAVSEQCKDVHTFSDTLELQAKRNRIHSSCGVRLIPNNPARFYRNTES